MKIIQLIPFLTRGGAEKVVVDLSNQLVNSGHDVTIYLCYPQEKNYLINELDSKIKIYYIYQEKIESSIFVYANLFSWINKNFDKLRQHDVIHCHLTLGSIAGSIFWVLNRLKNKDNLNIVIETNHSVGTKIKIWQKFIFLISKKMKDGYVLMAKNRIQKKEIKGRFPVVEFIPNGIDIKFQKSKTSELLLNKSKNKSNVKEFRICTIGRMVKERDPQSLIRVFYKLIQILTPEERTRLKIFWGGEGDAKNSIIKELIDLSIIDYFSIPGEVHNALELMANSDLYVTMNVGNVTGISGLEAAAVGTPVLAVQMLQSYIATDDDWIWSSKSYDEIALKIAVYIRNDDERENLALEQNKYIFQNLTSEIMAKRYLAFYENVGNNIRICS